MDEFLRLLVFFNSGKDAISHLPPPHEVTKEEREREEKSGREEGEEKEKKKKRRKKREREEKKEGEKGKEKEKGKELEKEEVRGGLVQAREEEEQVNSLILTLCHAM